MNETSLDRPDSVIGRSISRPGARRAVAGRGGYVDDLTLPRMVHLAFVRCAYAHARIEDIDTTEALALDGVIRAVTGAELAERMSPWQGTLANAPALRSPPQYALAVDRACWQGEPVVAIAAESRAIAEDAADRVRIDWRELPVVGDPEDALAPGAPVLHAELGDNLLYHRDVASGDADAAFAAADTVVECRLRFARHTGVTPEPRAIIASFDPSQSRLTLHHGGQAPHMIQVLFARHLGLAERAVRVIAGDVGGSYGIKSHIYGDEVAAAAISMMLGRPVKYVADRLESFVSDAHARDHVVEARMALDADGTITALAVDDLVAAGAYSAYPRTSAIEANQVLNITGGPYAIENYRARTRVAFQNKPPISQYRGVGHPIAVAVGETLVDMAAEAIGLDRLELRRRNLVPDDGYPRPAPSGVMLRDLSHQACLDKLVELMGYDGLLEDQRARRAAGVHRGIGIAVFIKGTNPGPLIYGPAMVPISAQDGCTVRLEPSGAVTCLTGVTEQGQGAETVIAQVVAETLGVGFEAVTVLAGDTDSMPFGGGTYGSRGAGIGGEAALKASRALRSEILDVAAGLLQSAPEALDIVAGEIVEPGHGPRMTLAEFGEIVFFRSGELADGAHPSLVHTSRFRVRDYVFTNGIHGCYVEIDTDTGFIRILDYWAVEDCGRVLNPLLAAEQVRGAVVQGLGDALYEHSVYDASGQLLNGTLADYIVPMAREMPDITIAHVETPTSETELGAKGAGESGTAAAPGAILSAVNDALRPLGARVDAIPITPEDVLRALGRI